MIRSISQLAKLYPIPQIHMQPRASPVAQTVKNPPTMQETQVWSLDEEDPLKKGMAIHSSIFAWRIPRTEEPGRIQSTGSPRVEHDWVTNSFYVQAISTSLTLSLAREAPVLDPMLEGAPHTANKCICQETHGDAATRDLRSELAQTNYNPKHFCSDWHCLGCRESFSTGLDFEQKAVVSKALKVCGRCFCSVCLRVWGGF